MPVSAEGTAPGAKEDHGVDAAPAPASTEASYIELVPGAAIAPTRDPSQRIDGLVTNTMTRHHAFGAVDGDDFADNQMRARSLVAKFSRPVQAAFKMDG